MGSASQPRPCRLSVHLLTAAMPASKKAAKKAKKSGSNVFDAFTQKQIAEFKEGFQIMDADKDGIISKSDLANTFTEIGREVDEGLLDEMLGDAPGPINFTTLLHMFSSRSSGESDDDDVVMASIRAFEKNAGQIEADSFRTMLMSFGDKFTAAEAEEAFQMFGLSEDGQFLDSNAIIGMLCAGSAKDEPAE